RINMCQHIISLTQAEIKRLENLPGSLATGSVIENFKQELESLRKNNLENATFEDKIHLLGLLNIRVYPSEDLKTVRIKTGFDSGSDNDSSENNQNYCGKVIFEPPKGSIGRTSTSCVLPSGGTRK
ncbi:MAG: hypothetical protein ABR914_07325, partial [Dehalococcoidales bacterium]